uniref:Uncharacterized protein n=1 Tax=Avena sativa TaxID=4498 RepID=A0ACD5XGP8_AVESA
MLMVSTSSLYNKHPYWPIKEEKTTPQLQPNSYPFSISSYPQARSHGAMSHTRLLYLQAHQNHAKFQDNHTSILKKEAAVGTTQPRQKQVKFQDNHASVIKKDDGNQDVDTVASDFIKRKHMSWGLQKSTTMYPAS